MAVRASPACATGGPANLASKAMCMVCDSRVGPATTRIKTLSLSNNRLGNTLNVKASDTLNNGSVILNSGSAKFGRGNSKCLSICTGGIRIVHFISNDVRDGGAVGVAKHIGPSSCNGFSSHCIGSIQLNSRQCCNIGG